MFFQMLIVIDCDSAPLSDVLNNEMILKWWLFSLHTNFKTWIENNADSWTLLCILNAQVVFYSIDYYSYDE